jgi:hypothetical protein
MGMMQDALAQVGQLVSATAQCFSMTVAYPLVQGLGAGTPAKVFSSSSRLTVQDKTKCMGWARQVLAGTPTCMVSHDCQSMLQPLEASKFAAAAASWDALPSQIQQLCSSVDSL